LSDDLKRKEFLDDLFAFMQKRGSPVNRIPIMAKHVLDLYELYRLVVAKGGLVEVINKKLWREITKGLNLPSSITSAAFTLRTQYMKYLYPYECDKLKMSTPQELQSAIDGNRREGRRPVYGFDYASPSGMSSSGGGSGNGNIGSNSSANCPKQNDLLSLNHQHHHHNQHGQHSHPNPHFASMLQHQSSQHHHAAFLAAAAAAAAAQNHLYDPTSDLNHHHHQLSLAAAAAAAAATNTGIGPGMPPSLTPFLKPYFEMNTPPTSSSSSSSSSVSSENSANTSANAEANTSTSSSSSSTKANLENENLSNRSNCNRSSSTPLSNNRNNNNSSSSSSNISFSSSSLKRPFDHLDQNMDAVFHRQQSIKQSTSFNTNDLKEPQAKKPSLSQHESSSSSSITKLDNPIRNSSPPFNTVATAMLTPINSSTSSHNVNSKLKIKILSKGKKFDFEIFLFFEFRANDFFFSLYQIHRQIY
jgi:hypothetical protein